MTAGIIIGWVLFGVLFTILVVVVIAIAWSKRKYKEDAYRLLKETDSEPKEIEATIKGLNANVGVLFKDEEARALIGRLIDKLG